MVTFNQIISSQLSTIDSLEFANPPTDSELEYLVYNEIRMMSDFFDTHHINRLVDIEKRLAVQYDDLLMMQPRYQSENIHYADYEQRRSVYQIFVYNKRFYDNKGEPITTQPLDFNRGAILVMDRRGNLFLSHKQRNMIHHSTFFDGGPVAYACMLEIRGGELIREVPWSGHYTPKLSNQAQFHAKLQLNVTQPITIDSMAIFINELFSKSIFSDQAARSNETSLENKKSYYNPIFYKFKNMRFNKIDHLMDSLSIYKNNIKPGIDINKPFDIDKKKLNFLKNLIIK